MAKEIICKQCDKKAIVAKPNGTFCSKACYHAWCKNNHGWRKNPTQTEKIQENFTKRFRMAWKSRYKTQQEAAKAIGISQSLVSKYTNGIDKPNIETLCMIADHFGHSTDWLLGRSNDPKIHR